MLVARRSIRRRRRGVGGSNLARAEPHAGPPAAPPDPHAKPHAICAGPHAMLDDAPADFRSRIDVCGVLPPRLWKLTGYGKLRDISRPPPGPSPHPLEIPPTIPTHPGFPQLPQPRR